MPTIFLALGSNQGDRLSNLQFAVEELQGRGVKIEAKSKIYRSASVESGGEGEFFNAVVRVRTELDSRQLLAACLEIEALAGREQPASEGAKRVGSRALDIDILLFGDEQSNSPALQLPHPRALSRPFVLMPLLDVLDCKGVVAEMFSW